MPHIIGQLLRRVLRYNRPLVVDYRAAHDYFTVIDSPSPHFLDVVQAFPYLSFCLPVSAAYQLQRLVDVSFIQDLDATDNILKIMWLVHSLQKRVRQGLQASEEQVHPGLLEQTQFFPGHFAQIDVSLEGVGILAHQGMVLLYPPDIRRKLGAQRLKGKRMTETQILIDRPPETN